MNNIACVCSPGQGCFRGGETCDNLGGLRGAEGGGGGQLQPGVVDKFLEFYVAIYIYLVALQ